MTLFRFLPVVLALSLSIACGGGPSVPPVDGGPRTDAGRDSGRPDAGRDGGIVEVDAEVDSGIDAGESDAGVDAMVEIDSGIDSGAPDGGAPDSGIDAGEIDAGQDAGIDTGIDSGIDAGDPCAPRSFFVETPGPFYTFDGGPANPTLTLCRGTTYTFDLTTVPSFHPIELFSSGIIIANFPAGVVTMYTVPAAAPLPDAYDCVIHHFGGAIVVP